MRGRQRRERFTLSQAFLLVVAFFPSNNPVRAKIPLPVQTVNIHLILPALLVINSITPVIFSSNNVPFPPGIIRTSKSSGALSKLCVGTMDWEKLELEVEVESEESKGWWVDTGDRVEARMERWRGWERERMFRASRGPVMSRSWKPGKRRTPIFVGGVWGVDMVLGGWLVMEVFMHYWCIFCRVGFGKGLRCCEGNKNLI